jgi:phage-related holin
MEAVMKVWLGLIGGVLSAIFAPIALLLSGLVALMFCDFLVALLVNGKHGAWSPEQGYLGWRRKAVTLVLIMALAIAQFALAQQSGYEIPGAQLVAGAFIILELISIGRNALLAGVRVPKVVRLAFAKLEGEIIGQEPEPAGARK